MIYHEVLPYLNTKFLYHTLWQIKTTALSNDKDLQKELTEKTEQMSSWAEHIVEMRYKYAPFEIKVSNNSISIGDFVINTGEQLTINTDKVYFQIVTLGQRAVEHATHLKESDQYADYFYWHGFCAALCEALAAWVHAKIRIETQIETSDAQSPQREFHMQYPGKRLSFGYQALPNIDNQREILWLLNAQEIGVTMSESAMLIPEYSTCAMVLW